MADSIKIGSLDISAFKVGSADCKIYLGDTLLYPQSTPSYKFVARYGGVTEYTVECDGGTALTASEVSSLGSITSLTSAEIGACGQATFKVGDNAFSGATNLTSVTIDDGVTQLGNQSFMYCSGLTSFTFPTGLTQIDGSCFRLANGIKRFDVPNGTRYLGSGCFADMSGLTGATIPSTVTGTSTNLFLRDSALKEVHFLGTTAPALGADAFKNTGIQKIYIPSCDCYDSYAATAGMSAFTNYIYAESGTKCLTTTASVKMATASNWSYSADTNGNVYHIQKSASTTGGLTTCSIVVSGITSIVFTINFSNNSSGIRFSSSKDNYASGTTLKTVNSTWTLSGLTSTSSYTIHCQLIKRSGTYVSGTGAGANITWT